MDILHLKWKEIKGDKIIFHRRKTVKDSPIDITVRLNDIMYGVLERWANEKKNDYDYVFPYLNDMDTFKKRREVVQQFIKLTNQYMNEIGAKLGITANLTTYVARHSFATRMMRSNAPLAMIKEKLGHKRIATTENYLGSFEEEVENIYLDKL